MRQGLLRRHGPRGSASDPRPAALQPRERRASRRRAVRQRPPRRPSTTASTAAVEPVLGAPVERAVRPARGAAAAGGPPLAVAVDRARACAARARARATSRRRPRVRTGVKRRRAEAHQARPGARHDRGGRERDAAHQRPAGEGDHQRRILEGVGGAPPPAVRREARAPALLAVGPGAREVVRARRRSSASPPAPCRRRAAPSTAGSAAAGARGRARATARPRSGGPGSTATSTAHVARPPRRSRLPRSREGTARRPRAPAPRARAAMGVHGDHDLRPGAAQDAADHGHGEVAARVRRSRQYQPSSGAPWNGSGSPKGRSAPVARQRSRSPIAAILRAAAPGGTIRAARGAGSSWPTRRGRRRCPTRPAAAGAAAARSQRAICAAVDAAEPHVDRDVLHAAGRPRRPPGRRTARCRPGRWAAASKTIGRSHRLAGRRRVGEGAAVGQAGQGVGRRHAGSRPSGQMRTSSSADGSVAAAPIGSSPASVPVVSAALVVGGPPWWPGRLVSDGEVVVAAPASSVADVVGILVAAAAGGDEGERRSTGTRRRWRCTSTRTFAVPPAGSHPPVVTRSVAAPSHLLTEADTAAHTAAPTVGRAPRGRRRVERPTRRRTR